MSELWEICKKMCQPFADEHQKLMVVYKGRLLSGHTLVINISQNLILKNFSLTICLTLRSAENERVEKASKNLQVLLNQEQILHKGVKEELENLKTDRTKEYKAMRFTMI